MKASQRLAPRFYPQAKRNLSALAEGERSVGDVAQDGVQGAGEFVIGGGLFFAEGAEVVVVFEFRLDVNELFVGEYDECFFAVFFEDLWVNAHDEFSGRLPLCEGYDTR